MDTKIYRIHPVFTKYKLISKRLKNTLILRFSQDGSDSVLTLFTPTKTVSSIHLYFLCNLKSMVRFSMINFITFQGDAICQKSVSNKKTSKTRSGSVWARLVYTTNLRLRFSTRMTGTSGGSGTSSKWERQPSRGVPT